MPYARLADSVAILHLGFILFALFGGLLAFRWRRGPMFHLPAALWAVLVELFGLPCPLTPAENLLRRLAGEEAYGTGFVAHYLLPLLYPGGLTRPVQLLLAIGVLTINGIIYARVLAFRHATRPPAPHE